MIPFLVFIDLVSGDVSEVFYRFKEDWSWVFLLIGLFAFFHSMGIDNYKTLRKLELKKEFPLDELAVIKRFSCYWHKSVNATFRFLFGSEIY